MTFLSRARGGGWDDVWTVAFVTLGCRVNQYETQALRERGEEASFREVPLRAGADLVVINTCAVTQAAETEAGYWARRAKRIRPSSLVVATGCVVTRKDSSIEGVDWVVPNRLKATLFERAVGTLAGGDPRTQDVEREDPWCGGIRRFEGHRRAILKVQDGCGFACSYCAVAPARGRPLSRPAEAIVEEGRRLAAAGSRELVLAGVHLASYGRDLGWSAHAPRLAPVVEGLLALPGIRRVRLSSYGVADFEEALLPLLGKGLCPHFHLPLQSGDPGVLKAMRRPYRLEDYARVVDAIRSVDSDAGVTTDLIVGFPGEGEEAFENTLEAIRRFDFLDFHPFPYSERPGTHSVSLSPKVPPATIRARMDRLGDIKRKKMEENALRHSRKVVEVVAERSAHQCLCGTTDQGWKVVFPQGDHRPGEVLRVLVTGFEKDRALGEVL